MTQELKVVLKLKDGTELPLLPGTTPQQSLDHHSLTYPELATATVGAAENDTAHGKLVYNITQTLGTKG